MGVGLSSPPKIFNALSEFVKALGFSAPKQFFDEPDPKKPYQPSPPYQVIVAQMNAQADVMIQQMKNQAGLSLTQMKEEAAAARTYFQTAVEAQSEAQDRFVRAVSEATDRMQELRLAAAEGRNVPSTNITVDGGAVEAAKQASDKAEKADKKVVELVAQLEEIKKSKPKKRTITAPSGKTYVVEDQS
jgi:hypothetical protein